jgi:hypothetical protein
MKDYKELNSQNLNINKIDLEIILSLLKENDKLKQEIDCLKNKIN